MQHCCSHDPQIVALKQNEVSKEGRQNMLLNKLGGVDPKLSVVDWELVRLLAIVRQLMEHVYDNY